MVTVDPTRFQAASALHALEQAFGRLQALPRPAGTTHKRLAAERDVWVKVDLTDSKEAQELMRAWSEVDSAYIQLLEKLTEIDEKAWAAWLAKVRATLSTDRENPSEAAPEQNAELVAVWAVERIPASLPEPAAWRSLEGFSPEARRRLEELRKTLTTALATAFAADF